MKSRKFFLFLLAITFHIGSQAQTGHSCLSTKKIIYHSSKAAEVYLVWGINYWQTPPSGLLPKNSIIKNKFAYSPLVRSKDNYTISITIPCDTRLDYYFYISKDNEGKEVDGWDTNNNNNYYTVSGSNESIELSDSKLKFFHKPFSIIEKGKLFLFVSFLSFLITIAWYYKTRQINTFQFLPGLFFSALVFIILSRFEISGFSHLTLPISIGTLFQDLLWLALVLLCTALLEYIFKNKKRFPISIMISYGFIVFTTLCISLLNIEVVRQLGTPFSYKWLYYSDFLKGNDAQVGAAKTLTTWYIKNLLAILSSFVLLGFALAIVFSQFPRVKAGKIVFYSMVFFTVIISYGFSRNVHLPSSKVQNPVFAFVSSLVDPPGKSKLSKLPIPDSVKSYFIHIEAPVKNTIYDSLHPIDNVIVFVSESTPAQYISLYDSTFECTPALKKWESISRMYTNMYAHIPSTPNSMLSILSGIYPMIDFRSALLEKIHLPAPSLPQLLGSKDWKTSLFFSSDLDYAGMRNYATAQNFTTVEDNRSIPCKQSYTVTHSNIDGLDDSCIVTRYLGWLENTQGQKTFSMIWTNQTHNPYYSSTNIQYSSDETLNRYLNALHHTDQVFDQLMTALSQTGKLNKTLVIFIADHGEAFNTHDQKLHASKVYEENVHIPCILYNPLLFNGERNKDISGLIDIAPSVAHVLGINKPSHWQGKSLLANKNNPGRTFFISPYTDLIMGTRHGQWKYIYNVDTEEEELFDLETDPAELNNRKSEFSQIALQEKQMLAGWLQYVDGNYKAWSK
jgi:arylsulfatase A-like enzyme